jgi:hypothetical protein
MDNEFKNMDNLFREHLENLEVKPSGNKWKVLSRRLLQQKLLFWAASGIVVLAVIIGTWFILQPTDQNNNLYPPETEITEKNNEASDLSIKQDIEDATTEVAAGANQTLQQTESNEDKLMVQESRNSSNIITKAGSDYLNSNQTEYESNYRLSQMNNASPEKRESFKTRNNQAIQSIHALRFSYTETPKIYPIINSKFVPPESTFDSGDEEMTKGKKMFWEIGVFGSPEWVSKTLMAGDPYQTYKQMRENGEENILSYSLGGDITLNAGNFFLRSGVSYSVYGEDARYLFDTSKIDSVLSYYDYDTTFRWIFDPPFIGEPLIIGIDSTYITVFEEIEMEEYSENRYQHFEVPLIFGYQTSFGKFNLEFGAGVSFGYVFKANATLPNAQLNNLIEVNEKSEMLRKFNINYIVQAGIKYRFQETWSIWIRPTYKRNVNSIFEKDYPVEQKFSTFGLQTGIHFRF